MNTSTNEHQSNHERRYPEDMLRRAATIDKATDIALEALAPIAGVDPQQVLHVGSSAVENVQTPPVNDLLSGDLTPEQARLRVEYILKHPEAINTPVVADTPNEVVAVQKTDRELEALEVAKNLAMDAEAHKAGLPEQNPLFDQAA